MIALELSKQKIAFRSFTWYMILIISDNLLLFSDERLRHLPDLWELPRFDWRAERPLRERSPNRNNETSPQHDVRREVQVRNVRQRIFEGEVYIQTPATCSWTSIKATEGQSRQLPVWILRQASIYKTLVALPPQSSARRFIILICERESLNDSYWPRNFFAENVNFNLYFIVCT